jgi:hypothetical protein
LLQSPTGQVGESRGNENARGFERRRACFFLAVNKYGRKRWVVRNYFREIYADSKGSYKLFSAKGLDKISGNNILDTPRPSRYSD